MIFGDPVLEFVHGPLDGARLVGKEAEKFLPFRDGREAFVINGAVYLPDVPRDGVQRLKFLKRLAV